ncbi:sugar phosphate isomerase/epimerase [Paenibacillus sp. WQ 127069]|uniref:Sugar phosphate isomerase/epimerase n=1 Tax=Paenibacillus baimaensis TaxID=2982185 RepID=A0ABT2UEI8_9BACL|nr:sugar phosphate isomerase/epimerase [Paenibacillus sp. WQ 127069]MCU6793054.1 sugar phosphate isomerase/epimerase [Paenibacillus sp. WQ 127069]
MTEFIGKIAVHAITWGQDHFKALEEASRLGYKAIEPWPSLALAYEDRTEELKEVLAQHSLVMTALYGGASGETKRKFIDPSKRQDIIEYNVRLAKIISKCGAAHLVFGPGGPRQKPSTLEELKEAATTINEAAKRTYELGVKACVHPHLGTEIQDENELDILMSLCDPNVVFFAPDTAHLTGAGMDPAAIIRRYAERVAYIHLKDLTSKDATIEDFPMLIGNEALPLFCELGLGTIHFPPVVEALKEINYTGWVTVEIDKSTSTPYRSLEICRDFVEHHLQIPVRGV